MLMNINLDTREGDQPDINTDMDSDSEEGAEPAIRRAEAAVRATITRSIRQWHQR